MSTLKALALAAFIMSYIFLAVFFIVKMGETNDNQVLLKLAQITWSAEEHEDKYGVEPEDGEIIVVEGIERVNPLPSLKRAEEEVTELKKEKKALEEDNQAKDDRIAELEKMSCGEESVCEGMVSQTEHEQALTDLRAELSDGAHCQNAGNTNICDCTDQISDATADMVSRDDYDTVVTREMECQQNLTVAKEKAKGVCDSTGEVAAKPQPPKKRKWRKRKNKPPKDKSNQKGLEGEGDEVVAEAPLPKPPNFVACMSDLGICHDRALASEKRAALFQEYYRLEQEKVAALKKDKKALEKGLEAKDKELDEEKKAHAEERVSRQQAETALKKAERRIAELEKMLDTAWAPPSFDPNGAIVRCTLNLKRVKTTRVDHEHGHLMAMRF